ncbi:MAG: T9SS type A sorting domain-containing protein [Saprospiraceae bacterium]|nr:T9SS type A sorting domain-containing protein [Saprospiraceae bacterium]
MRTILVLSIIFTGLFHAAQAQSQLKPFIGVDSLPISSDPVCPVPLYLGDFEDSGLFEGDTVPDFQLFTPEGEVFHLADMLTFGKPVLLVNGNFTCPVFRGKVPALNQLVSEYGNEVIIRVVYTVEAHPDIDISPYFGYVNTGSPNVNAGILYRQPTTYGERLAIINDMTSEIDIDAPILVDGPCNEWWSTFGPAPNNAYLINPQGIVVAKHAWFNRSPDDMSCDIDKYFNPTANCGGTGGSPGSFTFNFLTDTIAYGAPGDALYVEAELKNPSNNPVNIEIKRMVENIPDQWTTSMCIDICYSTAVDYTTIQIPAGGSQLFIMDFFTGIDEGLGIVQIGFRNLDNDNNRYVRRMWASTVLTSNTSEIADLSKVVFPNPANESCQLTLPEAWLLDGSIELNLTDLNGRLIRRELSASPTTTLLRNGLNPGLYFMQVTHPKNGLLGVCKVIFD